MPKDSADDKGAYIELRMGAGGVEAQIFAMDILEMYQNYAQRKGFLIFPCTTNETSLNHLYPFQRLDRRCNGYA